MPRTQVQREAVRCRAGAHRLVTCGRVPALRSSVNTLQRVRDTSESYREFAPNIGIRFTASTTAKVITSIAMPSTAMAARSPLSLRS